MFFVVIIILWSNVQGNFDAELFSPSFWRDLSQSAKDVEFYYYTIGVAVFFAVVAVVLFFALRFWSKTVFYIENGYLIYERNTMFKKKSKLPLEIISTVNLERNIFERIVGTAKVKLDINSAQTSNATDFTLVLSLKTAQMLKETLTAKRRESVGNAAQQGSKEQVIIAFTPWEVIRHKLLSLPIMQGLVTIAVIASQFYGNSQTGGVEMLSAAIFALGFGAVAVGVSVLNTLDYTVSADEKNFYITKGRLKKVSYTFSRGRINAVFVKQPMLARLFGFSSIEVAVIGIGNEKNETPCLCLLADKRQTERILKLCAENFSNCSGELITQSKAALIPSAFCLAAVCALSLLVLFIPEVSLAGVVIAAVITATAALMFMGYRAKSFRFDENVFQSTRGIFTKQTGMFRYDRLQTVKIKTNSVMRRADAEKMNWSILSGAAMKVHTSGWFTKGIFEKIAANAVSAEDTSTLLLR